VILGVAGVAGVVTSITANTRLQLLTPNHLRGRVMGIYVVLMGGTTPIGSFLLGEVAGHFGTGAALVTFGGATAAGVGLVGALRWHAGGGAADTGAPSGLAGPVTAGPEAGTGPR